MAIEDTLWKLFPIIYLMAGSFYNYYQFTNFVVKRYREENIFIYFLVLACCDVLVLALPLLYEWLTIVVQADIRSLTSWGCTLHLWLSGVALDVPPWVLVVMAYEKRALLWFPVPADSRFTRSTAKRVMVLLVLVCVFRQQYVLHGKVYNELAICYQPSRNFAGRRQTTTHPNPALNSTSYACQKRGVVNICDVFNDNTFFESFLTMYNPWLDLTVRWVGPTACLFVYNFTIARKIWRERKCAERLMEKVGIAPPQWFFVGVMEMEATVRWTAVLAALMCITTLPKFVYQLLQPSHFGKQILFSPKFFLAGHMLYYANHSFLYPLFAVMDNELVMVMHETWGMPLARKRGTFVASRPPCLVPKHCANSDNDDMVLISDRNYNNSGDLDLQHQSTKVYINCNNSGGLKLQNKSTKVFPLMSFVK